MEEYEEAKETTANVEFIQNYFEDAKAANTYADYSCCANIVEYDTYSVNGRKLYAYEGKLTESKIRKVNELLNFPVTLDEIFNNPVQIWEETEKKDEIQGWRDTYRKIIENEI